ncbi:conserved oligomeric Golgi complex subunit 7 isoform X3 [Zootermopsis nevadensis]|uniref:Conserved oligomeric Golgi complex subunit 7 n=1 Tax=Zootermopsis nevadensis TaxID=136037 RepID=A0A067QZY9_ZOONE|nr:conserved oligomeric Golgi complex subunit 7 isoform X3 [Zootermopsis nevadensis]KDR16116.1 Conserved oligomeric Golgi complex subunit 7 [Zootermopsis nevadensis]
MDVAAFSDDNFEVKNWINKTFKSAEAQENRDAFVSSLVMKLQLYVQQVNSALEDTSQQVLQSLPRVMRDTEILHQEALLLRDKMHSVKQEIAKVEQDTAQSMKTLERIDRIKTELQAAKEALHEADNWTVLATDLEEVFESGDIQSISAKLVSMQQSLRILANVPDYEDRHLQLEGLKNRLEAMASPLLVQAFTSASIEQSRVFVKVFTAIDRLPQLLKYYHKCQKGVLMQQWRNLVEMEQDEGIAEWMHKFYDTLLSNWHDQVKWCCQVFTSVSVANILIELYAETLTSLDPSFSVCIDAALKQQSDQLTFLLKLQQITKHFAMNLQVAVDSASQGKPINKEGLLSLVQAVYSPYVAYISKYAQYAQAYLSQKLLILECSKADLMDTIQSLGQSIPRAISIAVEANKMCLLFTEGCGYSGLIKALKVYINNYLDQYRHVLHRLEQQKGDREDWNMFQMCLTLLQNVGELLNQLKQLDRDVTHSLLDVSRKLNSQDGSKEVNSFIQFKKLLLSSAGQKEFDILVSSIQEGEETLLEEHITQSLNKLCSDVHHTTFQVIFVPISVQLEQVQSAPAWSNANKQAATVAADLPDFSFAPQEYITQIGQYLMTLPQHLEPFLLQDNPSLTLALQVADVEYGLLSAEAEGGFAGVLLGIIARGTCQTYCDNILGICELGSSSCKQLATDIDYLGNVLEDLGLSLSEHLQQVSTLLRLSPQEYQTKSSGCSPRLVAAVRQMRNITSSG